MRRRIMCQGEDCNKAFAYIHGDNTLSMTYRSKSQKLLTNGDSYTVIGTCSFCRTPISLFIKDGKLDESGLTIKEDNKDEQTEDQTNGNEATTDPGNGDNPNTNGDAEGEPAGDTRRSTTEPERTPDSPANVPNTPEESRKFTRKSTTV